MWRLGRDLNPGPAVSFEDEWVSMRKYLIIIFASLSIVSVLLLPIRQFNALRFLFGMGFKKGKKQGTSE